MMLKNTKKYKWRHGNYEKVQETPRISKKNKAKMTSFKNYCELHLKDSLLTGVTPVIEAKGYWRKLLQMCIMAFSVAGCVYQIWEFLDLYTEYPVVKSEGELDYLTKPALTICSSNVVRRVYFCEKHPDKCRFYNEKQRKIFCAKHKLFCLNQNATSLVEADIDSKDILEFNFTREFAFRAEDAIESCEWYTIDSSVWEIKFHSKCSDPLFFRTMDLERMPQPCYVFDSLKGKPNHVEEHFNGDLLLRLKVKWNPDDLMTSGLEAIRYHAYIHSPYDFHNPFYRGLPIKALHNVKAIGGQVNVGSLPPPYSSKCRDYRKSWIKSGGYGPGTKLTCKGFCQIQVQSKLFGCVSAENDQPHEERICASIPLYNSTAESLMRKCWLNCRTACIDIQYFAKATSQQSEALATEIANPADILVATAEWHIQKDQSGVKFTKPKYESVELFSYLGGFLGLWLGWSLIALFDLFGILLRLCSYPLIIRKQRKKTDVKLCKINHY